MRHPCPICKGATWCTVAATGDAVHCMRVTSGKQLDDGGFLHTTQIARGAKAVRIPPAVKRPARDWAAIAANCETFPGCSETLSAMLGVSIDALRLLQVGYSASHDAWTFPMRDAGGNVIGIRTRYKDGAKKAITGSRSGLFFCSTMRAEIAFVCEGPSDTAAILSLGLLAIGRPSCLGQEPMIARAIRRAGATLAVILPDNDTNETSRAMVLRGVERLIRALPRDIRPLVHHLPTKDAREWVNAGGTQNELLKRCGFRESLPRLEQSKSDGLTAINSGVCGSDRTRGDAGTVPKLASNWATKHQNPGNVHPDDPVPTRSLL